MSGDAEAGREQPTGPPATDEHRFRLLCTCCHPALTREARFALALRWLCGLPTSEVARALQEPEPAMVARIARATTEISAARISFRTPPRARLGERAGAAVEVLNLMFTTGHVAPTGGTLMRRDLVDGAIHLARLLHRLLPDDGEVTGLLALMLLTDSRRDARVSGSGQVVPLTEQDRSRWNARQIAEGTALLAETLRRHAPTRFAVQAAIAAVHAEAASWEDTDWAEIAALYDVLRGLAPSPVVELNRAVALGFRDGPQAGLAALDPLLGTPALATYPYLSAARADFLRRLSRWEEAATAYEEALAMTDNEAERDFLATRLAEVRDRHA